MKLKSKTKKEIASFLKTIGKILGAFLMLLGAITLLNEVKNIYKSSDIQEGLLNRIPLVISQPNINGVFLDPEQYDDPFYYLPSYCGGQIYLRSEIADCLFSIEPSQTFISLDKFHRLEIGLKNTGDDKIIIDFDDLVLNLVNYSDFNNSCPIDKFIHISECGGGGEWWYFDAFLDDVDLNGILRKKIELKLNEDYTNVSGEYIVLNPREYIRLNITIHTYNRGVHWLDFTINYLYKDEEYKESVGKFFIADESEQNLIDKYDWIKLYESD